MCKTIFSRPEWSCDDDATLDQDVSSLTSYEETPRSGAGEQQALGYSSSAFESDQSGEDDMVGTQAPRSAQNRHFQMAPSWTNRGSFDSEDATVMPKTHPTAAAVAPSHR